VRRPVRVNRVLMGEVPGRVAGMIVFFFAGWPGSESRASGRRAAAGHARVKPERIYREIRLVFAGSLHCPSHRGAGVEKTSLPENLFRAARQFHLERVWC